MGWNDSDFGLQTYPNDYDEFKELGLKGGLLPLYFPMIHHRRECGTTRSAA